MPVTFVISGVDSRSIAALDTEAGKVDMRFVFLYFPPDTSGGETFPRLGTGRIHGTYSALVRRRRRSLPYLNVTYMGRKG